MITPFMMNSMLHHVGMSWMITSKKGMDYENFSNHDNVGWFDKGPWHKKNICSKLAPLDYVDFYERKDIDENMENEMKEMNEKIVENPFKDDDNFDEAIPMQIRKERTTQAYKDNIVLHFVF